MTEGGLPVDAGVLVAPFDVAAVTASGDSVSQFPGSLDLVDGQEVGASAGVSLTVPVDASLAVGLDDIGVWTRETDADQWTLLPSFYDPTNGAVHAVSLHLSQFTVIGTPSVPSPGPKVVLDPDNDIATNARRNLTACTIHDIDGRAARDVDADALSAANSPLLATRAPASIHAIHFVRDLMMRSLPCVG